MRIFKYRSGSQETLDRDLKALANNQIYFSPIEGLNDPHESIHEVMKDTYQFSDLMSRPDKSGGFISLRKELDDLIERSGKWGVWSASITYNDELLWTYYAEAHKGFCVEYDSTILVHSLPRNKIIRYSKVRYQTKIPVIVPQDLFSVSSMRQDLIKKFIGTKSEKWAHEREIRVVASDCGLCHIDKNAIKAIHFGSRASQKTIDLVKSVMDENDFIIDYYRVLPEKRHYQYERTPI